MTPSVHDHNSQRMWSPCRVDGNFQRIGAQSNAQVGRLFEQQAIRALMEHRIIVERGFRIPVGIGGKTKEHAFDLGSHDPPILVECKSHRWTTGSNVPSAKMTVWNEAMLYFMAAPSHFRKILFVLRDIRNKSGEALATYYIRTYSHLIPNDVEIWEYDEETRVAQCVHRRE